MFEIFAQFEDETRRVLARQAAEKKKAAKAKRAEKVRLATIAHAAENATWMKRNLRQRTIQGSRSDGTSLADVIREDGLACYLCGRLTDPRAERTAANKTTLEHVKPIARGGQHVRANLKIACRSCNAIKACRSVEAAKAAILAQGGRS